MNIIAFSKRPALVALVTANFPDHDYSRALDYFRTILVVRSHGKSRHQTATLEQPVAKPTS